MEKKKSKLASWLKEPIISKKADPILNFFLAFLGATIGTAIYQNSDMSYWEYIVRIVPFAFLAVFLLKVISTVWRKRRKQQDAS
ncbi:hypothetical protein [Planococcus sp. 4-30]|uniref:hypothetical protein n=1 Tax=Planococcus sp. 4-30 TaxID=2874583 RepID=UPI001CBD8375|nr:hypothetical protein [Planococcus sp. 4-30]